MSERKMVERTMTVTFKIPEDFLTASSLEHIRRGLTAYANDMTFTQGAKVTLEDPPSKVSHAPCITGRIEIGGQASEFMLPLDNDSVRYSQWGADNIVLGQRVDLLEGMGDAARDWYWADGRPDEDNEDDYNHEEDSHHDGS